MKIKLKKVFKTLLVLLAISVVLLLFYEFYIWSDTDSVMNELNEITEEPPNSREDAKESFWMLNTKVDEDGNVIRKVSKITRNFTWVWDDRGTINVQVYIDDHFAEGDLNLESIYWILTIEKCDGKWQIASIRDIL